MTDSNTVSSKNSSVLAEFARKLEEEDTEEKELNQKRKEFQQKKLFVDSYKYDNELTKIKQNEEDIKRISGANVGVLDEEKINKIKEENRNYLNNLNDGLIFLDPNLTKLITAWPGNLILIGAATNGGKSSLTANLMLKTIIQKKPSTKENRKILVISNEESPYSVYNRLTCLVKGWNYNKQDEFTQLQKDVLIEHIGYWARAGITVIEDDGHGLTTSLEGIKSIFDNLFKTKTWYDMVILDYIQKVTNSKRGNLTDWQVMLKTMEELDIYKNTYPAPIVVTSQLKTQTKDGFNNDMDFKDRISGRKDILNPCTVGIELIPDRTILRSRFVLRKSRYRGEKVGTYMDRGFENGRFVPYTEEFKAKAAARKENKDFNDEVGQYITDKKEDKE
jgi:hypothetical protein